MFGGMENKEKTYAAVAEKTSWRLAVVSVATRSVKNNVSTLSRTRRP